MLLEPNRTSRSKLTSACDKRGRSGGRSASQCIAKSSGAATVGFGAGERDTGRRIPRLRGVRAKSKDPDPYEVSVQLIAVCRNILSVVGDRQRVVIQLLDGLKRTASRQAEMAEPTRYEDVDRAESGGGINECNI